MASRILAAAPRALFRAPRAFHTSSSRLNEAVAAAAPLPARKPMGAFRGGLLGFLLGTTLAGSTVYTYLLREYKASNELLTEDIYHLQAAVMRVTNYVQSLEEKVDAMERKKK